MQVNPRPQVKIDDPTRRKQMLQKLRAAVGDAVCYRLANGKTARRVYLDSTATTLALRFGRAVLDEYLPHYANPHTTVHFAAQLTTREYAWAHAMLRDFVGADAKTHGCFFVGSGATAGLNCAARGLAQKRPARDVVITTIMEHHSNDLPHRMHFENVVHIPVVTGEFGLGCVDVERMARAINEYGERVNYVAVTGASNVTGLMNPIYDIAELAHQTGAAMLVDAAQLAAHAPIQMSGHANPARDLDIVCLSGHKLYAPGAPGAVITRTDLFADAEPFDAGGGMVDDVYLDRHFTTEKFPDRFEAGTPNIAGAIHMAAVAYALTQIGMPIIAAEEAALLNDAVARLNAIDDVVVYAAVDTKKFPRVGAVSFNLRGLHHSFVAAVLNDYFNIAVRNACFCAHPYVREMISTDLGEQMGDLSNKELEALAELHRGMVRASFGVYSTAADVDALIKAVQHIRDHKADYLQEYRQDPDGEYRHKTFSFDIDSAFSVRGAVDDWFAR